MAYDSKSTKENLEGVLDVAGYAYQHVDAEKELSEMFYKQEEKPKASLKNILERLSKISAYMQELNAQEQLLLAELEGEKVATNDDPIKRHPTFNGLLPNLVVLCDLLDEKMIHYRKNIESLKNILG